MPKFSYFTGYGFLRFSSEPSMAEKIYRALTGMYRDPQSGRTSIETAQGTYQEAKLFAWAKAIAAVQVTLESAGDEQKPEESYYLLESHEKAYKMRPSASSTVVDRRLALDAKQRSARGPRYEALFEGLSAILGDDLIAIRPITTSEAETWPSSPEDGPGIFNRHDTIAKSIRFIDAVARKTSRTRVCDHYLPGTVESTLGVYLSAVPRGAQSFTGDGGTLEASKWYINGGNGGTVVSKIYAHSGVFGTTGVPTGAALATSEAMDVSDLILLTSPVEMRFPFTGANRITLVEGTHYFVSIEYAVDSELSVAAHQGGVYDDEHDGNMAFDDTGGWDYEPSPYDLFFSVITSAPGYELEIAYENADPNAGDVLLLKGDVLCVDPGNLGLVEKVTVLDAYVDDDGVRIFTAIFTKPHSADTYATTGTMPIWLGTKRHMMIVVKATAAIDPATVTRVHALIKQVYRGPTTWQIVQPTTPGATTMGPFKIGATLGSPLGAVPVDSMSIEV